MVLKSSASVRVYELGAGGKPGRVVQEFKCAFTGGGAQAEASHIFFPGERFLLTAARESTELAVQGLKGDMLGLVKTNQVKINSW
jgi:hypothetical protein